MNLAMLLILPASAAVDLPPPIATSAQLVPSVTTYNAFVATEETPAAKDLVQPAVLVEPAARPALSDWIA